MTAGGTGGSIVSGCRSLPTVIVWTPPVPDHCGGHQMRMGQPRRQAGSLPVWHQRPTLTGMLTDSELVLVRVAGHGGNRLRGGRAEPQRRRCRARLRWSGVYRVNVFHFTGGPCLDQGHGVIPPCGRCRQILFDYYPEIRAIVHGKNGYESLPSPTCYPSVRLARLRTGGRRASSAPVRGFTSMPSALGRRPPARPGPPRALPSELRPRPRWCRPHRR